MGSIGRTTNLSPSRQRGGPAVSSAPALAKHPRSSFLMISLTVVASSLFLVFTWLFGIFTTALNAASIAIFFFAVTMIIVKDPELRGNSFHPLSLAFIIVTINYGVRALTLEGSRLQVDTEYPGSSLDHLPAACLMMAIFITLCYGGYRSRAGLRLARAIPLFCFSGQAKRSRRWIFRAAVLAIIGAIGRADLIMRGYIHVQGFHLDKYFLQYLSFVQDVTLFTLYALAAVMGLALLKKISPVWVAPFMLVEILLELLSGARSDLFFVLLSSLALYSYYSRPIRWRYVIAGAGLIILVVVPLSFVWQHAFEKYVTSSNRGKVMIVHRSGSETIAGPLSQLVEHPDISPQQLSALARLGELDILLKVLDRVPRLYPFQKGDTFIPYFLEFPIPRFIWPSKPMVDDVTRKFAFFFSDIRIVGSEGTHIALGAVGELYYNFGYLGMIFSPLFGIIIRFFWERWKYYAQSEPCAAIRVPYIITQTCMFDVTLTFYSIGLVRGSFLAYLFMVLFYGRLPTIRWLNASK